MAQNVIAHQVGSIGEIAGIVWSYLDENEAVTLSKLAREIDAPRDLVMQGVGWLARENKVDFQKGSRSKLICLK